MEYKVEYHYSQFGKTKFIESVYLHFEKVLIWINLNRKYHHLNVYVKRQKNCKDKRKRINISFCLMGLIDYLECNQIFCETKSGFKKDILKLEKVFHLNISDLKICEKDCKLICKFMNLKALETKNCTIYEDCNLGNLKCNYHDDSSLIWNLDSFNGFEGNDFILDHSRIKHMNKHILHLKNISTELRQINLDYEHFFLTTDAPNMRKLEIGKKPRLKDKDLLFLSGFYNLESIIITGDIQNYEQVKKLEKLREIRWLFCTDEQELEITKEKRKDMFNKLLNDRVSLERIQNYLMLQRMVIQNQYQQFFHKIYVPRLESVRWQDKISSYDLEQIKCELQSIAGMSRKEKKQIASEPKKECTLIDSARGLWFDEMPKQDDDDDCYLVNSNPDPFELYDEKGRKKGIDYYVLKRKIHLEE